MTRVVLSTVEYDPLAPVEIEALADSDFGSTARRVNRVATLDAGAVFNDFGFTHADKTLTLNFRPSSRAHAEAVRSLVMAYPKITVATPDGLFLAAPESFQPGAEEARIVLLVDRKLSN